MKHVPFGLVAALCILMAGSAASQGLYFETTQSSGGITKVWYSPGKLKSVEPDGKISIIRLDKGTFIQVDPEAKTYSEMTLDDMKQMFSTGRSKLNSMMQKRLESLPPDKRKAMEERMATMNQGSAAQVKYDVKSTGETKTISGFPSTKYIVNRNGQEFETIWATKALGSLDDMHRDMEKLSQDLASTIGAHSSALSWFKEIPGFPMENDHHSTTSTVTKVQKQSVSDAEFQVPAGYTREESRMQKEMRGE